MNDRVNKFLKGVLAGTAALIMLGVGLAIAQDVSVISYDLESKKRVGRTTFEYEYSVDVQNATGSDVSDVSVTVSSSSPGVSVIDGEAVIGDVASGTTATSGDTVSVQVDRRTRFNPNQLEMEVDFKEPPLGVDANGDGVWDDVEMVLSNLYPGDEQLLLVQKSGALALQHALIAAREANNDMVLDAARERAVWLQCLLSVERQRSLGFDFTNTQIVFVESSVLSTTERQQAKKDYETILSGMTITQGSLQNGQNTCLEDLTSVGD